MRLNSEMRMLLDNLYNLRGEDSVVLVSMDKERDQAIKTKERTSKRTTELTNQIEKPESEGHILAKEGESFKSALETIRKDDFINVLKELNIAFDPEEIKKELEVKLPKTLEEFSMEKEKAEKELVTVEDEMNSATTKIEELGLRKDEALANQERLNRYFDLALEGNINITRDEITSLLEKFNFSEEEQREAAKLLMFPEDGLYEYEKSLKGIKSKSISDVFKEAKEEIKTEEINKETPVVEAPLHEEEPSFNFDFNINIPENKEVKEEQVEAVVEPVVEAPVQEVTPISVSSEPEEVNPYVMALSKEQTIRLDDEMLARFEDLTAHLKNVLITLGYSDEIDGTKSDNLIKLHTSGVTEEREILYYTLTYNKNLTDEEKVSIYKAIDNELKLTNNGELSL